MFVKVLFFLFREFSISFKFWVIWITSLLLSVHAFHKLFRYLINLSNNLNIIEFIVYWMHHSLIPSFRNRTVITTSTVLSLEQNDVSDSGKAAWLTRTDEGREGLYGDSSPLYHKVFQSYWHSAGRYEGRRKIWHPSHFRPRFVPNTCLLLISQLGNSRHHSR